MGITRKIGANQNLKLNEKQKQLLARYEVVLTAIEFIGGLMFIIGSILFFNEQTIILGTWFFLIGSFFFVFKPTLKLIREIHIYRLKKYDILDDKLKNI